MNNIIEILNHGSQRVQRLALAQEGEHAWEAYMGVFVVRVPGAVLPSDAEFATLKAAYEASVAASQALSSCIASRKAAYGPVEEQLDFMVKNGAQALIDRNLAIKAQFPKPVS